MNRKYFRPLAYMALVLATLTSSCLVDKIPLNLTPPSYTESRIELTRELSKIKRRIEIGNAVERIRDKVNNKTENVLEKVVKSEEELCEPNFKVMPKPVARWKDSVNELYERISPQNPIDKNFVYAMMNAESDGYHFSKKGILTSEAGAIGLMQLLPSTARRFVKNPYDAKQNLTAGMKYMNSIVGYLQENHPNWYELSRNEQQDIIAASYNMGEGGYISALYRAIEKGEKIKYPPETENHIKKVRKFCDMIKG